MLRSITVTDIVDIFTVDSPRGRQVQMRNRDSYGITFCYGGRITYYQNGIAVVSDRDHMVLLPKGQDYFLDCDASGLFPVINIDCTPDFQVTTPVAFPIHQPESYLKDYERLKELYLLGTNRAKCMSIVYEMLGNIAGEKISGNRIVTAAIRFIEEHFTDASLSNTAIANQTGVSEVYLRRQFKEACHTTPKQYILELRIRKAKQLLAEGHLCVNEIAESCGFSSVYHFSRAFHNVVGSSPTEYSKKARKKAI